jgi:hypothetical protein
MKLDTWRTILLSVVTILLVSAGPKEQEPWMTAGGVGVESCGSLLQAFRQGQADMKKVGDGEELYLKSTVFADWIYGYVSGYGDARGKALSFPDTAGILEWVRSYCERNPLNRVVLAAHALAQEVDTNVRPSPQNPESKP